MKISTHKYETDTCTEMLNTSILEMSLITTNSRLQLYPRPNELNPEISVSGVATRLSLSLSYSRLQGSFGACAQPMRDDVTM